MKLKRLPPPAELYNDQTHELNREVIETVSKEEVQLFLEKNSSRKNYNPFRITNKIKWENLKNSSTKLTVVEVESDFEDLKTRLILLKVQKEYFSRLIHTRTSGSQKDGFTGKIFISDLKGELIKGYKLKNGEFLVKFEPGTSSKRTEECNWLEDIWCPHMPETIVTANPQPLAENEYLLIDSGSGTNSEYDWDEAFDEPTWDFDDGLSGGGSGNLEGVEEEDVLKVIIDPSVDNYPCLANVLNEILNSNSELFKETIGQFIDNPKYDLRFTIGECTDTQAAACTNPFQYEETGEILIKFQHTDQNAIDFAASTLHEAVHAEIFRYVNEHHEGYVDPNDKPQLFDYFRQYKSRYEDADIDHIYMTQYYITPIAETLRELDNNQYPLNYYKTFAWDGLRNMDPNNSLGITDEEYNQYRNQVTENFNIPCDDD